MKRIIKITTIICISLCLSSCAVVGSTLESAYDYKAANDCSASGFADSLSERGQNPGCVNGSYSRTNIPQKWDDEKDE